MAENNTQIIHKIRNPKQLEHWISDWTATIEEQENAENSEEEYTYTITPSKAWRIPLSQIVAGDDKQPSDDNYAPVQILNPSSEEQNAIPIINDDTIVGKMIFNPASLKVLSESGKWRSINLNIESNATSEDETRIPLNIPISLDFLESVKSTNVAISYANNTLTFPATVSTGITQTPKTQYFFLSMTEE